MSSEHSKTHGSVKTELTPEQLFDVYKISVDEYRFNVQLGWDRTKFYFTVNTTLLAAGIAFMQYANNIGNIIFLTLVFILSAASVRNSIRAMKVSKVYYRNTKYKKTLIESILGLTSPIEGHNDDRANLAITTTEGQKNLDKILSGERDSLIIRSDTVLSSVLGMFYILMSMSIFGIGWSVWKLSEKVCIEVTNVVNIVPCVQ